MEQEGKSAETGSNSVSSSDTLALDAVMERPLPSAPDTNSTIKPLIGQTIPSPLTFDCLEEIIKHLTNDRPALFSCALVNRSWCRIAVSLLWCRPFEHYISIRKFSEIIRTYFSFLSETEKQLLRTYGIQLPNIPPLLFNYPKYLRGFDMSNFQVGLYSWLRPFVDLEAAQLCARVLGNFIFKQIDGLKLLKIENPNDNSMDISAFEDIHVKLRSLESVEFNLNWMSTKNALEKFQKLFSVLSQHSYYLKQISIVYNLRTNCKEMLNSMSELIVAQRSLESVMTMEFWNNGKFIYDILKTQSNSLKYLGISGVSNAEKLLDLIKVCKELRTLEIFEFKELDLRVVTSNSTNGDDIDNRTNTLNSSDVDRSCNSSRYNNSDIIPKSKLGKLVCNEAFSSTTTSYSMTMNVIIRMSNVHLQELILSDLTMELIECIQRQCPNLKKFCASMRYSLFTHLFPVLEKMKKLEYFYLQTRHDGITSKDRERRSRNNDISNDHRIVREFVKSLPSTLLHLEIDLKISASGLKILFGECKVGLRTLMLYNYILDAEIMKSVVEYARRVGTLRKFRYGSICNRIKIMENVMNEARSVIGNIDVI